MTEAGDFSYYEGMDCPHCGSRLRVVETQPTPARLDDGRVVNSSTYECDGPERHRWGDFVDLQNANLGQIQWSLHEKKRRP